ncbi:MAG: hypothetical protein UW41_C0023G0008 [Candidatus Collierbacteria bacterium GW2011_GWC2_44_18]|uniref:Uncharacterized protein n=1 Tax=Candidatus Collierbacteria bacterium GW2011_GWC2_44_18 TaxID=1618392 RepID=A0A0G1KL28_9BACT|nr:MAG: hypothetical protein UW16_C0014G0008 [Microgenomates group bacterium GW2011_GWC1_44_10]KKT48614.1 MAG: hypothetical protein UW41_C0023G0008 [Candidatus Collierbacteria bacterium GW2011_GWC2_44_18]
MRVFDGRVKSFFNDFCRSSDEEYERSVRPTPFANRVSPVNRIGAE